MLDRYYTPDKCARACVRELGLAGYPLPGKHGLEAGVGGGAFAREMKAYGMRVSGVDLDAGAPGFADCDFAIIGDFLRGDIDLDLRKYDYVIGNPPYKHAQEFVELGLQRAPVVAYVLRSAFLSGARRYKALHSKHQPRWVFPLAERPSFVSTGATDSADYSFIVWERGWTGLFRGRVLSWK